MSTNKSKLEFVYSQIVAKYINERLDFKHFIQTCHKNKDAALSLKTNNFSMIIGDEIRFPNIETQIIYTHYDIPLIYANRKIKYIKPRKTFMGLSCHLKNNIKLNYEKFKNHNIRIICIHHNDIPITISNGFNSLTKLVLDNSYDNRIYSYNINVNLPSLKCLSIINFNKTNFTLFTPNLIYLDIRYFKSLKIKEHKLLMINICVKKGIITCNFNYPFYYNGIKCNNLLEYNKVVENNIICDNKNFDKNDLLEYLISDNKIKDELDFKNTMKTLFSFETVSDIYHDDDIN